MSSGIYLYHLQAVAYSQTKKLLLSNLRSIAAKRRNDMHYVVDEIVETNYSYNKYKHHTNREKIS